MKHGLNTVMKKVGATIPGRPFMSFKARSSRDARPYLERLPKKFLLIFCLFISSNLFAAEKLPEVLKWGADAEGGAPYIFQDPANPEKTIGYEVELVEAIGKELGVKTEFIQNQWDGLIPGLDRGNYDMVVNGLEITPDRAQVIAFSNPYYVTAQQLTVRKETYNISTLKDCQGKTVGTLKGALAERMLQADSSIKIMSYDGQVNAYEDLAIGRSDAVLQDQPIAVYYGQPNPKLKLVGGPIGEMSYGIGIRKKDKFLLEEINRAIDQLKVNGKLREIYERWNLWNPLMEKLLPAPTGHQAIEPSAYNDFLKNSRAQLSLQQRLVQYLNYLPLLCQGAVMTLTLSLIAMTIAMAAGLPVALGRIYGNRLIRWCLTIFVEVIRGTPLLIQLYLIFYGLPNIGIKLNPFIAAIFGLGLNYAAYEAENYRAGFNAVPTAQTEASLALGMTRWQSLRYVVIPQATRLVIPPMTNDFISLLKDSSLVSVITMVELTKMYGQLASTNYDYLGVGLVTATLYLLIGLPFVGLSRWAEKKFSTGQAMPRLHP